MEAISICPTKQIPNMFNPREIEQLILRHRKSIYMQAIHLCKNPDLAEDLVQETVFHGIKNLYQLKDRSKSKYWMSTILKNQYFKIYGQNKRLERMGKRDLSEFMLDENIPEKAFLDWELGQEIRLEVEKLANHLKVPLQLFYFNQLSYKEISKKLLIPIGTVMSRIARAKVKLKKKLLNEKNHNLLGENLK
ncbi:MAG: RNA polymerase sigma factor [Nitrospinales bacterium]